MKQFVRAHRRAILLSLSVVLIALTAIGGTLAWLVSVSSQMTNTFVPAEVPITVRETFPENGTAKTDVYIHNDGNMRAYIRAALVPIWRDKQGNGTGLPANLEDQCNITLGSDWEEIGEYYYYNAKVEAGGDTTDLIESCTVKEGLGEEYNGLVFELQVLAQSVQAEGMGETIDTPKKAFDLALSASAGSPR